MRRGLDDDLLAISPPPEFQDRPALPPPVFRDLSPSPGSDFQRGDFTNPLSSPNLEVPHCKRYIVHQIIRDFADKISFNILNEAIIIAALVPASGSTELQSHNSTPSCPFSSDSSGSETLSTTTSWEYLSRTNSISDNRRCTSPHVLLPLNKSKKKHNPSRFAHLKKSTSEGQGMMRTAETTSATTSSFRSERGQQHNIVTKRDSVRPETSISESNNEEDVCYTVPYQCDIYSLPIDSITQNSQNRQPTSTNRSHRRVHREKLRRGPRSFPLSSESRLSVSEEQQGCSTSTTSNSSNTAVMGDCSRTVPKHCTPEANLSIRHRNHNRQRNSVLTVDGDTSLECHLPLNVHERNNNNDKGDSISDLSGNKWCKKRRSKSVEIDHHNSINFRKSSHQPDRSIILAEDHGQEDTNTKDKRNFGRTLLNLFRRGRPKSKQGSTSTNELSENRESVNVSRALPSPPSTPEIGREVSCTSPVEARDFAVSIEKVKDCGWYWGPLSSEAAEDLLRGEPDGSFIVRDSSDAHYIFSLTFKLNGLVRHVRIEHDQGNFSFGPLTRFKSATIVDFVEKAVAHSRSGRYLFFLHRRPVLGPMRVQLLHPYSRFRHPRSLQHMCRFVILKYVRRDRLDTLPLPKPLVDYLNTPHYYFEHQEQKLVD